MTTMNGAEQLATIIPMLRSVGGGIEPAMFDNSTPCAEFAVAAVLDHMTGLASTFAPAFRGETPDDDTASAPVPRLVAFDHAMSELLAAVGSDGALDRVIATPGGPMAGADFARMVALDGMLHGWDLATATGQAWEPPSELLAEVDGFARSALSAESRGENFGPERAAADGATAIERLAAFSGRIVGQG